MNAPEATVALTAPDSLADLQAVLAEAIWATDRAWLAGDLALRDAGRVADLLAEARKVAG